MSTSFHICGSRTVNANLVPAATISAPLCWFGHGISNHHLATKCSLKDSAHVKSRVKIKESPLKKCLPSSRGLNPKGFWESWEKCRTCANAYSAHYVVCRELSMAFPCLKYPDSVWVMLFWHPLVQHLRWRWRTLAMQWCTQVVKSWVIPRCS